MTWYRVKIVEDKIIDVQPYSDKVDLDSQILYEIDDENFDPKTLIGLSYWGFLCHSNVGDVIPVEVQKTENQPMTKAEFIKHLEAEDENKNTP